MDSVVDMMTQITNKEPSVVRLTRDVNYVLNGYGVRETWMAEYLTLSKRCIKCARNKQHTGQHRWQEQYDIVEYAIGKTACEALMGLKKVKEEHNGQSKDTT